VVVDASGIEKLFGDCAGESGLGERSGAQDQVGVGAIRLGRSVLEDEDSVVVRVGHEERVGRRLDGDASEGNLERVGSASGALGGLERGLTEHGRRIRVVRVGSRVIEARDAVVRPLPHVQHVLGGVEGADVGVGDRALGRSRFAGLVTADDSEVTVGGWAERGFVADASESENSIIIQITGPEDVILRILTYSTWERYCVIRGVSSG